ncbi:MAG TPA: P-loop NTPase, partial [Candidatus Berkiella sp.]|nr:P-loop NTPase [Candidatus Berkiella sp.]
MNNKIANVIAITGGKGGIGKTTLSVNLGIAIAQTGKKTYLLDADFGLSNVDVMLGLKPQFEKNVLWSPYQ